MGKMRMGILDGFVGKVGTVVGSFWKGKKVMRGYVEFAANPRTRRQLMVRARFAQLASMGSGFLDALNVGMAEHAKERRETPANSFMDLNWGAVTATAPDELLVELTAKILNS